MTGLSPAWPARPDSVGGDPDGVSRLGAPGARLLAGLAGREDLAAHLRRLGALPDWSGRADQLVGVVRESGLAGRGGGYFPLAAKLESARSVGGPAVVVINATESEPASVKDRTLLHNRPHLLLDGAQALAAAVGASRVIVAVHRSAEGTESLRCALRERLADIPEAEVALVPDHYLAGESSALVSHINGGPARPEPRQVPTSVSGVGGRPTVVSNAETASHLALITRFGAGWFREAGTPGTPGSVLVTVTGDVTRPGCVLEVTRPVEVGAVIAAGGGSPVPPQAVLTGGYAGTWTPGERIWRLPLDPLAMTRSGIAFGCGLLGVFGSGRCGLVEAARLMAWLSGERAGQCGACTSGLPAVSERLAGIADGSLRGRREIHRLVALTAEVSGRGLCSLPDGAAAMAESALVTFHDEVRLHRRGSCSAVTDGPLFPLPRGQR